MTTARGVHRWLLAALTATTLLATATGCGSQPNITGGSGTPYGPKPPPLRTHDPYVFRVTVPQGSTPLSSKDVRLPDGTKLGLGIVFGGITRENGRLIGDFVLWLPDNGPKYGPYKLAQGSSVVVGGFRLTVLKIYLIPNSNNSAADVRITPVGPSAQG